MHQSYAKPSLAVRPLKAFVVLGIDPVESITAARKPIGVFPFMCMDADSPEDIYAVYGTTKKEWEDRRHYVIVPADKAPQTAVRTMNHAELGFIAKIGRAHV